VSSKDECGRVEIPCKEITPLRGMNLESFGGPTAVTDARRLGACGRRTAPRAHGTTPHCCLNPERAVGPAFSSCSHTRTKGGYFLANIAATSSMSRTPSWFLSAVAKSTCRTYRYS